MTLTQWIQTIIEFLMIVAVVLGFIYEPVLTRWERTQKRKVLTALKKRKEYRK